VQQAYQRTLADDVAAAPVIDAGAFDHAPDNGPAVCILRHDFPRLARDSVNPSAEALPVRLGLDSGHHDRGSSSISGDELHSLRFAPAVSRTAFGAGGLRS
jgi:hypothetical protein